MPIEPLWKPTIRPLKGLLRTQPDFGAESPPAQVERFLRPDRSPGFLVADGFGSCSVASSTSSFRPWVETMRPKIEEVIPAAQVRGFSYGAYGTHYCPAETARIQLLRDRQRLVESYVPLRDIPITYLAFSVAAPLFTLGLAGLLQRKQVDPAGLQGLILVQPALALQPDFVTEALEEMGRAIPAPLFDIGRKSDVLVERFLAGLSVIVDSIPLVKVIYWPRDSFTPYSNELRDRLKATAPCREINPAFAEKVSRRPFIQHGAVNYQDVTIQEIQIALWQS